MAYELQHGGYLLSDDRSRLNVDVIHRYLAEESYWARGATREIVECAVENSLCIGAYANTGEQIGLIRAVTDYATFAWVCDVFVLDAHRRRGLAKAMVKAMLAHPRLSSLRRFTLGTRDAHGLYAQFGFTPLAAPERWMERVNPNWNQPR
jgi:GNAT superfamily N-acetyltransferase